MEIYLINRKRERDFESLSQNNFQNYIQIYADELCGF